jgi:hypothetical protein
MIKVSSKESSVRLRLLMCVRLLAVDKPNLIMHVGCAKLLHLNLVKRNLSSQALYSFLSDKLSFGAVGDTFLRDIRVNGVIHCYPNNELIDFYGYADSVENSLESVTDGIVRHFPISYGWMFANPFHTDSICSSKETIRDTRIGHLQAHQALYQIDLFNVSYERLPPVEQFHDISSYRKNVPLPMLGILNFDIAYLVLAYLDNPHASTTAERFCDCLTLFSTCKSWHTYGKTEYWRRWCRRHGFACLPGKEEEMLFDRSVTNWFLLYFCGESRNRRRIQKTINWILTNLDRFQKNPLAIELVYENDEVWSDSDYENYETYSDVYFDDYEDYDVDYPWDDDYNEDDYDVFLDYEDVEGDFDYHEIM